MKRIIFFIISTILIGGLFSCTKRISGSGNYITEQRTIGAFTGIRSEGDFEIVVVQSAQPGLTITAEDNIITELATEIENGILLIHFRRAINVRHDRITITASTSALHLLSMVGSGSIRPQGIWEGDQLTCDLTGSGEIFAALSVGKLIVSLAGSGVASFTGDCGESDFTVAGSGNIRSFPLMSNRAKVSVSGSGNCELTAVRKLEANISGSGKIFYKGEPVELIQHISGSGRIIKQ